MMRVAIVGDYPVDETRLWGGVEAAFIYLARELARLEGLDLHVITLGKSKQGEAHCEEREGFTLHVLPPFPRFEFALNFRTFQANLDRQLAEIKPDLVHAQGATDHAYGALRSGYRTVITVHGVQSEDSKHQATLLTRARKRIYGRLIERYNLSHTGHLIAIGRYVVDFFRPVLRRDARVYYIPNAIDDRYFRLQDKGNGCTILYAGRVIRRKRALDLVRAFGKLVARMPSARLRLAGEFNSEPVYAEQVRHEIETVGLGDRVRLLGGLSEEAIQEEFAGCDVLALPSIQETTPMVIAQAMAAGKPIVATPVGGVAEMVHDGETGYLVPVGEVDGLTDALLRLLADPLLRTRMGQAGRNFADRNYRAASVAHRTREAYLSIASAIN